MKYPQSVAMPRDVEDWLEEELEARGIDSVVYTKYILSLMLQDSFDPDICDSVYNANPYEKGVWSGQRFDGSFPSSDQHELNRLAVVRCLMAASTKTWGIESLVDQLYAKLRDFQSEATVQVSATVQPSQFMPYIGCNNAFQPLQESMDDWKAVAQPKSARTLGILHVSQPENDAAISYDDLSPYDYFPLSYSSPTAISGNTLDIYGPRLYERSCNRNLERFMGGLDENMHQYWRPQDESQQFSASTVDPNQSVLLDYPEYYSSAFQFDSLFGPAMGAQMNWSLGGKKAEVFEIPQICFGDRKIVKTGKLITKVVVASEKTHFHPIPYEELLNQKKQKENETETETPNQKQKPPSTRYQDGTTFLISNDLEPLEFQRSASGMLFLESGKYMEYKTNAGEEVGDGEFIPKFRVQQSNEKYCQTDDSDLPMLPLNDRDSICSSSLELDEYYYADADDFDLALELSSDETPDCGEVAGIVTGCLNVRLKAQSWEEEPTWGAREEAMVDGLVNSPAVVSVMNEQEQDDTDEAAAVATSSCLVSLKDNIWSPTNSEPFCANCKDKEKPFNRHSPVSSDRIWSVFICDECTKLGREINLMGSSEDVDCPDDDHNDGNLKGMNSEGSVQDEDSKDDGNTEVSQCTEFGSSRDSCTYDMMKEELSQDGNQLLSDLSGLHLYQNYDIGSMADPSLVHYDEEHDTFPADILAAVTDKGPSVVSFLASLNIFAIGDETNFDERIYDSAGVQKERRRRHSLSQKMCEQPLRDECRRAHCRYRHYTSPRVLESVCVSAHAAHGLRHTRDVSRSFTV